MRSLLAPVLIGLTALATSCNSRNMENATPERPGRPALAVVVHGTVRDGAGAPLPGVRVTITAFRTAAEGGGSCSGAPLAHTAVTTPADGAYRETLEVGVGPEFRGCVRVETAPPPGTSLRDGPVLDRPAWFRTAGGAAPPEEVRADVVLRP
jgi:hypothetical protein